MGDPIHHLRDLVRAHGIRVLSSNYTLYGDMQRGVVAACEAFARDFEIYSIDETFLAHARDAGAGAAMDDVGIANTKTLAKFANATAKKDARFDGVAGGHGGPRTSCR